MSDSQQERADALRRLLTEAVEPVQPSPGSQARLEARIRGEQPTSQPTKKRRDYAAGLRWSAAGLATAGVITGAVILSGHSGRSDSTSSSGSSAASAPTASSAAAGPSAAAAPNATELSPPLRYNGGESRASTAQGGGTASSDLDGDGLADGFALNGRTLVVTFSRGGQQSVTLPVTGPGARVLGVTPLKDPGPTAIPVAFIRLEESAGTTSAARDTMVALVAGRLTALDLDARPAVLVVDATSGYACDDAELVLTGHLAPYVVQGDQLVASPRLRAVQAAPGKASGCW